MKTSGVLLPPASLTGSAPRNVVSSWKSVTTPIPVSLENCGNSGVIAFDQGWRSQFVSRPLGMFPVMASAREERSQTSPDIDRFPV
jgi:hypothetical protein